MEKIEIPEKLKKFEKEILETVKPFVKVKGKIEKTGTFDSKFGGNPYLPLGYDYPKDEEGKPMKLLAQINFEELPELEQFPKQGILQFYISSYDMYGMDFDDQIEQKNFRVIYHKEIERDETKLIQDFSDIEHGDDLPFETESKLSFELNEGVIPYGDFKFGDFMNEILRVDEDIDEDEFEEMYANTFRSEGHKIGGYPYFTQNDPRDFRGEDKEILLLQIDTDGDLDIMWGDAGIGNFFISKKDLLNLDFSRVLYNWDCC